MNLIKTIECLELAQKGLHAEREVEITTRRVPRRFLPTLVALLAIVGAFSSATASVWTGEGDESNWFHEANWDPVGVPGNGASVTIDGSASVLLTNSTAALASLTLTNATLTVSNWTTRIEADTVTVGDGGTITLPDAFLDGAMSNRIWVVCGDFLLADGGLLDADGKGYSGGVSSGQNGHGPGATTATGAGAGGTAGAGHGGVGGTTYLWRPGGIAYGSLTEADTPGSGSGGSYNRAGANGGGVVRIEATRTITVNGTVTALGHDGQYYGNANRHSGGGSGGSIYLSCETFAGTGGSVIVDGGAAGYADEGGCGGGAGGRIALHFDTAAQNPLPQPTVRFSARPGDSYRTSYATGYRIPVFWLEANSGTLYFSDATNVFRMEETITGFAGYINVPGGIDAVTLDSLTLADAVLGFETNVAVTLSGDLVLDGDSALVSRHAITLSVGGDLWNAGAVRLDAPSNIVSLAGALRLNGARFDLRQGSRLGVTNAVTLSGSADMIVDNSQVIIGGDFTLTNTAWLSTVSTFGVEGTTVQAAGDVSLASGTWIRPHSDNVLGGASRFVCRNLTVATNSGFHATGLGHGATYGDGAGEGTGGNTTSAGAGYGGRGGDAASGRKGGEPYGERIWPARPGSGGGSTGSRVGGPGGGAIWIEVDRHLQMDGELHAGGIDGVAWGSGGRDSGAGSGGGILLVSQSLGMATNAVVSAMGGDAYNGGGAGGGGRIAIWYGLSAEERQPLLDNPDDPSVQHRLVEFETLDGLQGTVSAANGTGGHQDGDPGTLVFIRMLSPPGTMIILR